MDLGLPDNSGLFHLKIINLITPQRSFFQTWLHLQVLDVDISFWGPPLNPLLSLKHVKSVHFSPSSLHHPGPSLLGLLPQIFSNWPLWLPFLQPNNPFFLQPEDYLTIYLKSRAPCPSVSPLHAVTHAQLAPTDNLHLSMSAATSGGLPRDSCAEVLPNPTVHHWVTRFHFIRSIFHNLQGSCLSTYLPIHPTHPSTHL